MIDTLKDIAAIVACGVAICSMIIALRAFLLNKRSQKETIVQRAHSDYLTMAMDNPDLSFPRGQQFDLKKQELNGSSKEFERYEWFVSTMLSTVS